MQSSGTIYNSPELSVAQLEQARRLQEERTRQLAEQLKPALDHGVDAVSHGAQAVAPILTEVAVNVILSQAGPHQTFVGPMVRIAQPIVTQALQQSSAKSGEYSKEHSTHSAAEYSASFFTSSS